MPELPEVEVVRAGIAQYATGATIDDVAVVDTRGIRRHTAGAADFQSRLRGTRIAEPRRRGKFLWIPLERPNDAGQFAASGEAILVHLGMSGQVIADPLRDERRHERVRITVSGAATDSGDLDLVFVDQRTFGSLAVDELVPIPGVEDSIPAQAAHIARDPLDPLFDAGDVARRITGRRSDVKRLLLDQNLVSGIGNIYADESLWHAGIHGRTPGEDLTVDQAIDLLAAADAVMREALAQGGTSFDEQYKNVNGESGYFARSLKVYAQQGRPCPRCGAEVVRETFMNRGSHFCPRCQRLR